MTKLFINCCILFSYLSLLVCGQTIRTIHIETSNARPVNLSEIAEKVTPIALEKPSGIIQHIFMTNEYLFLALNSSVVQCDLSGKFIREIKCDGYVTNNVTCDTIKRELYIPVGDKIRAYDFSGKLKREFSLKTKSLYCICHRGFLWIQSYDWQPDRSSIYTIDKVNLSTAQVTTLSFEKKIEPIQSEIGSSVGIGAMACLSLYNDEVVVSFDFDSVLYKIQQDKVIPFVQWKISPPAKTIWDTRTLRKNGIIGENLLINYRRNDLHYTYLENMKTGKQFNVRNLVDDIFQTSGMSTIIDPMDRDNFYFIREKSDIKGNNVGNIPLKNGPVIFVVKMK
jgi:hypothetical protein